jgi:hypothetical protein
MTKTGFILGVVIIYAIYYASNIVYDMFFKKELKVESDLNSSTLDVSSLMEAEYTSSIVVASEQEEEENDVTEDEEDTPTQTKNEDPSENTSSENGDVDLIETVFDTDEVANVTHHGGYSVAELKHIFSDLSDGGNNPFVSVTAKMI